MLTESVLSKWRERKWNENEKESFIPYDIGSIKAQDGISSIPISTYLSFYTEYSITIEFDTIKFSKY